MIYKFVLKVGILTTGFFFKKKLLTAPKITSTRGFIWFGHKIKKHIVRPNSKKTLEKTVRSKISV